MEVFRGRISIPRWVAQCLPYLVVHMPFVNRPVFLLALLLCNPLQGSGVRAPQVLYITHARPADGGRRMIDTLCDFYGLTCDTRLPKDTLEELGGPGTLAVIVDASALDAPAPLPQGETLRRRLLECRVPVLVLCAEPRAVPPAGQQGAGWTAGVRFTPLTGKPSAWRMTQSNPRVTRELTGLSGRAGAGAPAVAIDPASLSDELTPLMLIQSEDGLQRPTYVEGKAAGGPVFFAAFSREIPEEDCVFGPDVDSGLPGAVPILTFLRFAGGPYCWHRRADYANLTIDDPWLTEPFGCLSYPGLLAEMQKARFHTTIAFVPWYYDSSDDGIVAAFRDHPEYYSLCVHGNNHDRWEFYRYRTIPGDPTPARPLAVQEADIRQGLARMERLRQLTGLDYDRVMVFPHFIAPEETLTALKRHNYLMTVNARNLPMDLPPREDRLSPLLGVTLRYGNFVSVRRHLPASLSRARIALELFLDNPVIFYEHHGLFRRGMDAFNGTAELVNTIQPETKWAGLGEIARHLYSQRDRPDGGCDIKAFSGSIELVNDLERERVFHIEKAEVLNVPIEQVLVDGVPCTHTLSDGSLRLTVAVGPHRSCRVDIRYKDDFQPSYTDISRSDPRVNRIRALSDFRDCTLAGSPVTTAIVRVYYAGKLYKLGLKGTAVVCCVFAAAAAICGAMALRRVTRPKSSPLSDPAQSFTGVTHAQSEPADVSNLSRRKTRPRRADSRFRQSLWLRGR